MRFRDVAGIAAVVLVAVLLCFVASQFVDKGMQEETELINNAVRNAARTCYAVEGAYPESVEYLRKHYGLAYDEERYIVSYDGFASNLMPDIRVLERGVSQ